MADWTLSASDLKRYPHFDKPLTVAEAIALATNPEYVRRHGFFPLLSYEKKWQPFRRRGVERKKKERLIRYAARADSYIYSRYRHILSEKYEALLQSAQLSQSVIAYRKIAIDAANPGGKCNIHFAYEAFDAIAAMGNCCVVALDISKFFESIDHGQLKKMWCRLLDVDALPEDHFKVFKNITQYAEARRDDVYERLGYRVRKGRVSIEYTIQRHEMPLQLCSTDDLRSKIAEARPGQPSLIKKNKQCFGIPQGAPISDLLANMYLFDFDCLINAYVRKRGGVYFRYSDDILIAVPGDGRAGRQAREFAYRQIRNFGEKLLIKPEKSATVKFCVEGNRQVCVRLPDGKRNDGLEYLGFRFDGRKVYFRESTLTNLRRKIVRALRAEVFAHVARYPGNDETYLLGRFDVDKFMQKFGPVEEFEGNTDYHTWTFWTYARRASAVMGARGQPLFLQLQDQRRLVSLALVRELRNAIGLRPAI